MKLYENLRFAYPGNLNGEYGSCAVAVYGNAGGVLVTLADWDEHGTTSVTNAVERVIRLVDTTVLATLGLSDQPVRWLHWSPTDHAVSEVTLADQPHWRYVPPSEFARLMAAFGGSPSFLPVGGL
jgi:hypothetical protein